MTKSQDIVFIDIVGSSHLFETYGALKAAQMIHANITYLSTYCQAMGGISIKNLGDGLLFSLLASPALLVNDLLRLSHYHKIKQMQLPLNKRIELRMGAAHSELIPIDGEYYGLPIHLAQRLCHMALAGDILVDENIYKMSEASSQSKMEAMGRLTIKGIQVPHECFRVRPTNK